MVVGSLPDNCLCLKTMSKTLFSLAGCHHHASLKLLSLCPSPLVTFLLPQVLLLLLLG